MLRFKDHRLNVEKLSPKTIKDVDLAALEKDFVAAAGPYAARKGISCAAFRAVGGSPAVLKAAGISRSA